MSESKHDDKRPDQEPPPQSMRPLLLGFGVVVLLLVLANLPKCL